MEKTHVETLTDAERKRFRMYAYGATWCGCFAEVMMENSAILILFMTLMGSSASMQLLSTSMNGILSMLLMFFAAGLADRFGAKRSINTAVCFEMTSCLLIASAPFWGRANATYVILVGCVLFCVSRPIWTASWYVVMGDILLPAERGPFLGFMRFSYYTITGVTFFLIGCAMGKESPIWIPQTVIAATGILAIGRAYFISKIRLGEHPSTGFHIREALSVSVKNGRLVSFSVYVAMMYLAFAPVLPLSIIYMKQYLQYGDGLVQILSTVGIAGSICGFLLYGTLQRVLGMRLLQWMTHTFYIAIPLSLALFGKNLECLQTPVYSQPLLVYVLAGLTLLGCFAVALFGCIVSQETLALARPGNVAMTSAFNQTYVMIGTAAGRFGMSIILGAGVLSATWTQGGMTFSCYQTLFFLCAAIGMFALFLIPGLPSMVPEQENWYKPK
ncbi:MAG: hypothetical protein Q4D98_00760 [Planctomycetia bacterium]|nr:hypothetical protein [Planctomycetia bacterium]